MQSIIWERRNLAIYCDTLFVTMLSWQVVELLVNCQRSWNPRRRKITYQHPTAFNRVPSWNLHQIWTWVTVFAIRKKLSKLGSYIPQTMPRKHDNIFPQRKSILFSCNDWIPTMTTTISSMWSAKVNLQFPTKKFTALKESDDFAFEVRSLSTHRIPVVFGGYEHSTQKRIQQ